MRCKTRVFATNTLTILPEVDMIVVLKDGSIQEIGNYEELRSSGGEFSKLLTQHIEENSRSRTLHGKLS